MKKKRFSPLSLMLAALFFLNACGTREYASPPSDSPAQNGEKRDLPQGEPQNPFAPRTSSPGYLWGGLAWIGVPEKLVSNLKCRLSDSPAVNEFNVTGTTLLGGAVLGMVMRFSGSWLLGRPIPRPGQGPEQGHWFWDRLDQTLKTAGQGAMRGSLFSVSCETMMVGSHLLSLPGFLGQSFAALSGSIALGGMSSMAAAPYIKNLMSEGPPNPGLIAVDEAGEGSRGLRGVVRTLTKWTKESDLVRGVRYRVAPGLIILGIGGGVGMLIYDRFQADDGKNNCDQDKTMSL